MNIEKIPSCTYVLDEKKFRANLQLIKDVKERAGVNIILAFKSFALWKAFPIVCDYIHYSTASSEYEAQLAYKKMGSLAHTFSPAYTKRDFPIIMRYSSHITFNSLTQYAAFYPQTTSLERHISCGLRINPEYSPVETALYNPCAPGSRFGILAADLQASGLPKGVEGFHFHALCESTSYELEKTLRIVEEKFGEYLPQLKWLNMGGGHLMTRADYDTEHLISVLKAFKAKHPNLELILEPGSAFAWQTGVLVSSVVDIVENSGIKTAILDVSFTCHMPDCLEMPYKPVVQGATDAVEGKPTYRLGGCSCLSGDFMGDWSFDKELQVGDKVVFEDMIHYTIVKTNMFNGITHPSIALWTVDGKLTMLREFGFDDYKCRMS